MDWIKDVQAFCCAEFERRVQREGQYCSPALKYMVCVFFLKQHELVQLPSPRDEVLFISISIYVCFLFQSLETTKAVLMHFDVQTCILLN